MPNNSIPHKNKIVARLTAEKETLLKNPNPSDAEVNRLADVNRALDAGDLNPLVKTALNVSKEMQEIYKNTISEEELDQALKNRNDEDTADVVPERHTDQ